MKNRRALSEEFEIKIGVKQGDRVSPMFVNITLTMFFNIGQQMTRWGYQRHTWGEEDIKEQVDCIVLADNIAIETEDEKKQLDNMSKIVK